MSRIYHFVPHTWSNEDLCKYEWSFYHRYSQTWLRTGSNELAKVVNLLRAIFAGPDVQIVLNALEENGILATSAESDNDFYANHEIYRYIEDILENCELKIENRLY